MSEDHKAALSEGRRQGITVREYLEALETNKPKRGRKRTETTIAAQLDAVVEELNVATGIRKLELVQRRRDLERELSQLKLVTDMSAIEEAFVAIAAEYGSRRGIEYGTWREIGVPADVLVRCGVKRTRQN